MLAGVSITSITFTESMIKGFTGKNKRYFRQKCDHIKGYLDKMEILLLKIKEDDQVMRISRKKTEYFCMGGREEEHDDEGELKMQGEKVLRVTEFRYLGSTVQVDLEQNFCSKFL